MAELDVERKFIRTFVFNISLITPELNFSSFVIIYRDKFGSLLWGGRGPLREAFLAGQLPTGGFELGQSGPQGRSFALKRNVDELGEFSLAAAGEHLVIFRMDNGPHLWTATGRLRNDYQLGVVPCTIGAVEVTNDEESSSTNSSDTTVAVVKDSIEGKRWTRDERMCNGGPDIISVIHPLATKALQISNVMALPDKRLWTEYFSQFGMVLGVEWLDDGVIRIHYNSILSVVKAIKCDEAKRFGGNWDLNLFFGAPRPHDLSDSVWISFGQPITGPLLREFIRFCALDFGKIDVVRVALEKGQVIVTFNLMSSSINMFQQLHGFVWRGHSLEVDYVSRDFVSYFDMVADEPESTMNVGSYADAIRSANNSKRPTPPANQLKDVVPSSSSANAGTSSSGESFTRTESSSSGNMISSLTNQTNIMIQNIIPAFPTVLPTQSTGIPNQIPNPNLFSSNPMAFNPGIPTFVTPQPAMVPPSNPFVNPVIPSVSVAPLMQGIVPRFPNAINPAALLGLGKRGKPKFTVSAAAEASAQALLRLLRRPELQSAASTTTTATATSVASPVPEALQQAAAMQQFQSTATMSETSKPESDVTTSAVVPTSASTVTLPEVTSSFTPKPHPAKTTAVSNIIPVATAVTTSLSQTSPSPVSVSNFETPMTVIDKSQSHLTPVVTSVTSSKTPVMTPTSVMAQTSATPSPVQAQTSATTSLSEAQMSAAPMPIKVQTSAGPTPSKAQTSAAPMSAGRTPVKAQTSATSTSIKAQKSVLTPTPVAAPLHSLASTSDLTTSDTTQRFKMTFAPVSKPNLDPISYPLPFLSSASVTPSSSKANPSTQISYVKPQPVVPQAASSSVTPPNAATPTQPSPVDANVPESSFSLFVADIHDDSVSQDDMKLLFSTYGRIQGIRECVRPSGSKYYFIHFPEIESVNRAISEMNGKLIGTTKLKLGHSRHNHTKVTVGSSDGFKPSNSMTVSSSKPNNQLTVVPPDVTKAKEDRRNKASRILRVAGLHNDVTQSELIEHFSAHGGIILVDIIDDEPSGQKIAFIHYKRVQSANIAMVSLKKFNLMGLALEVTFQEETEGKSIWFSGNLHNISELLFKAALVGKSKVQYKELFLSPVNGLALVAYENCKLASQAYDELKDLELKNGSRLDVAVVPLENDDAYWKKMKRTMGKQDTHSKVDKRSSEPARNRDRDLESVRRSISPKPRIPAKRSSSPKPSTSHKHDSSSTQTIITRKLHIQNKAGMSPEKMKQLLSTFGDVLYIQFNVEGDLSVAYYKYPSAVEKATKESNDNFTMKVPDRRPSRHLWIGIKDGSDPSELAVTLSTKYAPVINVDIHVDSKQAIVTFVSELDATTVYDSEIRYEKYVLDFVGDKFCQWFKKQSLPKEVHVDVDPRHMDATRKIVVNNLAEDARSSQLRRLFGLAGRVLCLQVRGRKALISYENIESALKAVEQLQEICFQGRRLQVKLAKKIPKNCIWVYPIPRNPKLADFLIEKNLTQFFTFIDIVPENTSYYSISETGFVWFKSEEEAINAIVHCRTKLYDGKMLQIDFIDQEEVHLLKTRYSELEDESLLRKKARARSKSRSRSKSNERCRSRSRSRGRRRHSRRSRSIDRRGRSSSVERRDSRSKSSEMVNFGYSTLYINALGIDVPLSLVESTFSKYATIKRINVQILRNEPRKNVFVHYVDGSVEAATKAIMELDKKAVEGFPDDIWRVEFATSVKSAEIAKPNGSIYIAELGTSVPLAVIEATFSKYATLSRVREQRRNTEKKNVFVEFLDNDVKAATKAIEELNNKCVDGHPTEHWKLEYGMPADTRSSSAYQRRHDRRRRSSETRWGPRSRSRSRDRNMRRGRSRSRVREGDGSKRSESPARNALYISALTNDVPLALIESTFSKYASISRINEHKLGRGLKNVFVHYADEGIEVRDNARKELNGQPIEGFPLLTWQIQLADRGSYREKEPSNTLYLADLSKSVTRSIVEETFSKYGPIRTINEQTRSSEKKNFFVHFNIGCVAEATKAKEELNNKPVPGYSTMCWKIEFAVNRAPVDAEESPVKNALYVYGLATEVPLTLIESSLSKFGSIGSINEHELENGLKNVCVNYVDEGVEVMENARKALNDQPIEGFPLFKWRIHYTGHSSRCETKPSSSLFLANLSRSISRKEVDTTFAIYGPIRTVQEQIRRDGKKNFFVHYDSGSVEAATKAKEELNNRNVPGYKKLFWKIEFAVNRADATPEKQSDEGNETEQEARKRSNQAEDSKTDENKASSKKRKKGKNRGSTSASDNTGKSETPFGISEWTAVSSASPEKPATSVVSTSATTPSVAASEPHPHPHPLHCTICVGLHANQMTSEQIKSHMTQSFQPFGTILRIHVSRHRTEASITFQEHASVVQALAQVPSHVTGAFCLGFYSNASDMNDEYNIKTSKKIRIDHLPSEYPSTELLTIFQGCGVVNKMVRSEDSTEIHFIETRSAFLALMNTYIDDDVQMDYCYPYLSKHLCIDYVGSEVFEPEIADFFDRIGPVEVNIDRNHRQAIVTMDTTTEAVMAREFLHGGFLGSERVTIDFADDKFLEKFRQRQEEGTDFVNKVLIS